MDVDRCHEAFWRRTVLHHMSNSTPRYHQLAAMEEGGDIEVCCLEEEPINNMKECGLCAVGGVGFFCCLCGTAFHSIQERIAHKFTAHSKLEGHIPIRFTSTQARVLLANSVQFELEIRTDVKRSIGKTFLALVNSNNLRGMSCLMKKPRVVCRTCPWTQRRK